MKEHSYGIAPYIIENNKVKVLVNKTSKCSDWNFFKGKIEPGEKIIQCAHREFYEEYGISLDAMDIVNANFYFQYSRHKNVGIFPVNFSKYIERKEKIDKKEIFDYEWLLLDNIVMSKNQRKIQNDMILYFNKLLYWNKQIKGI